MSLYTAETRRLVKRRAIRYLGLVGVLILLAIAAGTYFTHELAGPAELAAAQQRADADYQQQTQRAAQMVAECERVNAAGDSQDNFPDDCSEFAPPPRESFEAQWYMEPSFDFRDQFEELVVAFAGILAMVAFVVGASFVGAEWSTGGMMNLLLWRPRRARTLLTKLTAFLVGMLGYTLVLGALWTAGFWVIAYYRGSNAGMTPGAWQSFGLLGLRSLGLILVAGTVGFALASLGRRTVMALGVVLGGMIVMQFGLAVVLELANVRFWQAYMLPTYVLAWLQKSVTLQDYMSCEASFTGECDPTTLDLTWQMSGGLMAAVVVLTLGAALWTMRSRDVT